MNLLILSDIHGNETALRSVLNYVGSMLQIDACVIMGDVIDYGMHSNEVIQILRNLGYPIICNIRGNHEQAIIMEDYSRFSTERGKQCAQFTRQVLSEDAWDYLKNIMQDNGKVVFEIGGKKCLAVHGSLEDIYWGSIKSGQTLEQYMEYDYVFSGHSHLPHFIEMFYKTEDLKFRNKKKTIFINPGSVGQPRNLNSMAQFAVFNMETEEVLFKKVYYNIKKEQEAYNGQVDVFYKERLESGI